VEPNLSLFLYLCALAIVAAVARRCGRSMVLAVGLCLMATAALVSVVAGAGGSDLAAAFVAFAPPLVALFLLLAG